MFGFQLTIPAMLSQERVLDAMPSWLRFICTTRRDAKVLHEFRSLLPVSLEIDAQSQQSKDDVSAYIQYRVNSDSAAARLPHHRGDHARVARAAREEHVVGRAQSRTEQHRG